MNPEQVEQYINVLEKTNQQLSLGRQPLSTLITTLGVLFAILSIVAAIIIYLQSQDFRKQKKELLTKHENYFNFHNRKLINLGTRYQNLIKQLENNQNSNNNEAQKLLSELRKEKDLIRSELYNNDGCSAEELLACITAEDYDACIERCSNKN